MSDWRRLGTVVGLWRLDILVDLELTAVSAMVQWGPGNWRAERSQSWSTYPDILWQYDDSAVGRRGCWEGGTMPRHTADLHSGALKKQQQDENNMRSYSSADNHMAHT